MRENLYNILKLASNISSGIPIEGATAIYIVDIHDRWEIRRMCSPLTPLRLLLLIHIFIFAGVSLPDVLRVQSRLPSQLHAWIAMQVDSNMS